MTWLTWTIDGATRTVAISAGQVHIGELVRTLREMGAVRVLVEEREMEEASR